MKRDSIANLRNCLEISNGRLREAVIDLEEMIHAAVTGEGLQVIRDNAEYQRIARGVSLRKNRKPVLQFAKQADFTALGLETLPAPPAPHGGPSGEREAVHK